MLIGGTNNFGKDKAPSTLTNAPRASIVNRLAGRSGNVASVHMEPLARPGEAVVRPDPSEREPLPSFTSRIDMLPQYSARDTNMPPPYESKEVSEW